MMKTRDAEPGSDRFAEVLRLAYMEGLGVRAIALRLKMARKTVRKVLGRGTVALPKVIESRSSLLDSYGVAIGKMLEDTPELKAPVVLERLRPLGYTGGISILRERIRTLRPRGQREPFLTLDFKPGQALQVDWADFGFALPGCPRRVSAFVAALAYSRYLYIEFRLSQSMGTFLRCMERALAFFAGSTLLDIFDNMKTVVRSHTARQTLFNARFLDYARARGGFGVVACNVRKANEKGRVERPIGFVRERFWPGRRFKDLFDLNAQAATWRDDFANNRVHHVTGKVPALVYAHEEKKVLLPVRDTPFDTDEILSTAVTKSFRVSFDRNRYSVPPRLLCQTVVVRGNDDAVGIYLGTKQVALHRRCWTVGQDIEHPSHRERAAEHKPRAAAGALPPGLVGLGEIGVRYFKVLAAGSRSIHREMVRLTFLVELFGETATVSAMDEVMQTGHVGAEYVEYVLRHKRGLVPAAAPLRLGDPELDAISFREPDLSIYDRLVPVPMTLDPGTPTASDPAEDAT
jgi:transposase